MLLKSNSFLLILASTIFNGLSLIKVTRLKEKKLSQAVAYSKEEIKELKLSEFQQQSFAKQVEDYFKGKAPSKEPLFMGETPLILKKMVQLTKKWFAIKKP